MEAKQKKRKKLQIEIKTVDFRLRTPDRAHIYFICCLCLSIKLKYFDTVANLVYCVAAGKFIHRLATQKEIKVNQNGCLSLSILCRIAKANRAIDSSRAPNSILAVDDFSAFFFPSSSFTLISIHSLRFSLSLLCVCFFFDCLFCVLI